MPTPQALAKLFCEGKYVNDLDGSIWRDAFEYLAQHVDSAAFQKSEVHTLWTVNGGHLRRKVQDDYLVSRVLRKSLPGYQGHGLTLYRGECQFLFAEKKVGFCWTPRIEVAALFARGLNAIESGGVLLKAFAPAEAILAAPNEHSARQMQEFEYTCDPEMLRKIVVVEYFPRPQ